MSKTINKKGKPNEFHSTKEPIFISEMPHPKILKGFLTFLSKNSPTSTSGG